MFDRQNVLMLFALLPASPTLPLAYYTHQLSSYIVRFYGNFGLHWYGFAYVMAFVVGYLLYHWLAKRGYGELPPEKVLDFITLAAIFGVMLGGRLGWILFYGWDGVRAHPVTAFKLWEGGMASHGGIMGLVIFTWVYARWQRLSWPGVGDNLVVVAPIGLLFGRLANFVNGELWGRVVATLNPPPWAMRFPKELAGGELPPGLDAETAGRLVDGGYAHDPAALARLEQILPLRHPSQLYEAGLEGVVLFTILWIIRTRMRAPVGMLTGVFMVAYAVLRIVGEQFREPDIGIAFTWGLTRGQFLSLFLILIGGAFIAYSLVTRRYQLPGMRPRRTDSPGAATTKPAQA